MSYKIFLVEDDKNLNTVLCSYLVREGFEVSSFLKGEDAIESIYENPHLWILDIMLPDVDGFTVLKEIKANNKNIPVIFISARDADIDRIVGLEMGSDDYLAKPFMPRELVIRTKKLLDRTYKELDLSSGQYLYGYLIETDKRIITKGGEDVGLSSKEFDLLMLFLNNKQKTFSRDDILNMIWGESYYGSDRVVDDLVRRLRKRMPELRIETVYGFGYRLN
ncbi:response regulator transcription factor [Clostridium folliculivorans]|uniref:Stage 0 sporulation protein A homolog n=1 Tax=Clostridium folliculivorans TaxID=2886038 RepID=A0A9W6DBC1_9CLOT|nr:response regulator transcription factor [Clostridium folliculivorans]GKU25742.1 transcriptional regulatory protein CssR [Clostridium folliculivorans]GKU28764.1 transcriptional regulatory protein CssR [Clostridium folliculivorans]